MVTPFNRDLSVNFELAGKLARRLIQSDQMDYNGTTEKAPRSQRRKDQVV